MLIFLDEIAKEKKKAKSINSRCLVVKKNYHIPVDFVRTTIEN